MGDVNRTVSVPLYNFNNCCSRYHYKCKKLQFIHTVNGDGSKTSKIIKRQC